MHALYENDPCTSRPQPASRQHDTIRLPELYQVLIECRDEAEQRELFERLRNAGLKVRLLVL
jgi:hypothetical protein